MTETASASTGTVPQAAALAQPVPALAGLDVSALSHPGRVRTNNEDQFFVTRATRSLETMMSSLPAGDVPERAGDVDYIMAVADGMGGCAAGEVASRLAISALINLILDVPDWIFKLDEERTLQLRRRARRLVQQVGSVLVERARENPALHGMGSTLTGARSCGRSLLIAHVGDSRAYLFRTGRLQRLTRDHTYAQMLVDMGQLSPDEAARSRMRHILTNVLGGSVEDVEVDVDLLPLRDGDRLLLCSDGLTNCVDDDVIEATLSEVLPPSETCHRLLQLALDAGGPDNITVIVAAFAFPSGATP